MKRRQFLAASGVALALPAAVRAEKNIVIKFAPVADLSILDPIWTLSYVTRAHGFMVFDTLYGQTGPAQGFVSKPQMLTGHTIEDDGRTWKLSLRDGLMFHDGTKVLARDCVASIRRWGARDSFGQTLMQRTADVSAPDDRTIVLRLHKPFALLPDALGKYPASMCAIMPERLAATDPFKQVTEVVGSGPFRFKADEHVGGSLCVYERFRDYKPRADGEPDLVSGPKIVHFDRVEWHVMPDKATATAALQNREVDWVEFPTQELAPLLRRDKGITVQRAGSLGFVFGLRPNHLFPPFEDPAIRRAVLGAIDQTAYVTAAIGADPADWQVPTGFFPIASPMASDVGIAALTGPRDLGKVRKDLEAAAYRGERIVALVPADAGGVKGMGEVAVDMLRRVGMNVDYQAVDFPALVQRTASKNAPDHGGWNIYVISQQGMDCLTPATHRLLRGNGTKGAPGWPSSPKLETLHDQWFDAPDLASRKRICAEIQAQAFIDLPYLPLGTIFPLTAYRSDLAGVMEGQPLFWNVHRV